MAHLASDGLYAHTRLWDESDGQLHPAGSGAANAQDRGDGGYSRTLGGTGGISSEYYNYWNDVQDNAVAMWWNGGYTYSAGNWYYGGLGWGARFP